MKRKRNKKKLSKKKRMLVEGVLNLLSAHKEFYNTIKIHGKKKKEYNYEEYNIQIEVFEVLGKYFVFAHYKDETLLFFVYSKMRKRIEYISVLFLYILLEAGFPLIKMILCDLGKPINNKQKFSEKTLELISYFFGENEIAFLGEIVMDIFNMEQII